MQLDPYDPIYTISVVARLLDLHEQTLRQYERLGLICPCRSIRKTRLYSQVDVTRLECINYLVKTLGVNLAGVRILVQISNYNPQVAEQLMNRNFSVSDASIEGMDEIPLPEEPYAPKHQGRIHKNS